MNQGILNQHSTSLRLSFCFTRVHVHTQKSRWRDLDVCFQLSSSSSCSLWLLVSLSFLILISSLYLISDIFLSNAERRFKFESTFSHSFLSMNLWQGRVQWLLMARSKQRRRRGLVSLWARNSRDLASDQATVQIFAKKKASREANVLASGWDVRALRNVSDITH